MGYKTRLLQAGKLFASFCDNTNRVPRVVLSSAADANAALVSFIQFTFDSHRPLWVATFAILVVQNVNRLLKGQLRPAWDSVLTWKLSRPIHSRTPLLVEILKAICYSAVMSALCFDKSHAHMWLSFAAVLRFSFYALLRPKEIFGLLRCHIKVPSGSLL